MCIKTGRIALSNPNVHPGFFNDGVSFIDPEVASLIDQEKERQQTHIELVASENIVSKAVLEVMGSVLTNKTVEGYSGKRYFSGVHIVDQLEDLAIKRARSLFGCEYANVQPHSGSQANHAVFMALLKPGDKILSMDLSAGGHLSHGASSNLSGKVYEIINYGIVTETGELDYEQLEKLAFEHRPKLIIAGGSSYSRIIDFKRIGAISKSVDSFFLVDMAHFSGLVAAGIYPSPLQHADVVTTTTYKSLRGPRGGLILSNNLGFGKKINSAIFPGIQGTPMLQAVAAKAVCFLECSKPEFKEYCVAVIKNANILSETLRGGGMEIISGGTDTGLFVVDLRKSGLKGNIAAELLDKVGLTCNKNAIPNDPEKPMVTSGIRLSSNAGTTRGLREEEFRVIGEAICEVLNAANSDSLEQVLASNREKLSALIKNFSIY
jgi:glycine hydroxymethyltransferase